MPFLYFLAIFADFIAPFSPTQTPENKISYSPPIKVNFSVNQGFYFHPLVLKINEKDFSRTFKPNQNKICKISFPIIISYIYINDKQHYLFILTLV